MNEKGTALAVPFFLWRRITYSFVGLECLTLEPTFFLPRDCISCFAEEGPIKICPVG